MDWQENGVGIGQMNFLLHPAVQTCSTYSPTEALRTQVEGVEPVDASGEVCIVSAVCVANTNA